MADRCGDFEAPCVLDSGHLWNEDGYGQFPDRSTATCRLWANRRADLFTCGLLRTLDASIQTR